jgi:hypothetical protein
VTIGEKEQSRKMKGNGNENGCVEMARRCIE